MSAEMFQEEKCKKKNRNCTKKLSVTTPSLLCSTATTSHQFHPVADMDFATEVMNAFVLLDLRTPCDIAYNAVAQFEFKMSAFEIVEKLYLQAHNTPIDEALRMRDCENDERALVSLGQSRCVHYLIRDIAAIVSILLEINSTPAYQNNMYIFAPYCKQLLKISSMFLNDYCCNAVVERSVAALNTIVADSRRYLDALALLQRRVNAMCVFLERDLYRCNICHTTSAEEHFLIKNTCCGYQMCGVCYAKLWQFCKLYPVCPACKVVFAKDTD
ncbi:ie-0 [Lambdina fiscellaria nucleopolyhedrovirus]|uniref:Ie-0 n=1 Tax=Lambdina fiscellaria nucleopolyhedrovirus TaxID=1642929 RepID=A0A0E3Z8C5_9ABAC|nr:ie-0 [Lambdina fiscellaria nucleopolyhedrovirus]AKC91751.1 ie-0 [Lambdina fiscellaria nucleopolyhedrovirus]